MVQNKFKITNIWSLTVTLLTVELIVAQDDCPGIRLTSGLAPLLGNIPLVSDPGDLFACLPSLPSGDCLPPLPPLSGSASLDCPPLLPPLCGCPSLDCPPLLPPLFGCPSPPLLPPLSGYPPFDCLPELPCSQELPCLDEFPGYDCGVGGKVLSKPRCLCKPSCLCKPVCSCKSNYPPAWLPYPYQSKSCCSSKIAACKRKLLGCKEKLAGCAESVVDKKLLPLLLAKGLSLGIGPDVGCGTDLSTLPGGLTSLVSNVVREPLYNDCYC